VVRIAINEGELIQISATGGTTLLEALYERGVNLPSSCGGQGSCGLCKVRIEGASGACLPLERPWLTDEELAEGTRLACQVRPAGDVRLHLDKALLGAREHTVRVVARENLTPQIVGITCELPGSDAIDWSPGQYIQIHLPDSPGAPSHMRRAYSLASRPGRSRAIEIEVQRTPGGIGSGYLIDGVRLGDTVKFSGPYGGFERRRPDLPLLCVAGGAGAAPVRSVLLDAKERPGGGGVVFLYAAPTFGEVPHAEELRSLERDLPGFTFVPVVSRLGGVPAGLPPGGEVGSIIDVLDRRVEQGARVEVYLCGSPRLVDGCSRVLAEKGIPSGQIHHDRFV